MAKKRIITLIDDIDGTGADETLTFAIDGRMYEIDLSVSNATALRAAIEPYRQHARLRGRARAITRAKGHKHTTTSAPATHTNAAPTVSAQIRAWAHTQGLTVPAMGRIPQAVIDAYRNAHT